MALSGILSTQVVFNGGISDTVAHVSSIVNMDYLEESVVIIANTHDQGVVITTQYSDDGGVTWATIGTSATVAAGATLVANQFDQSLTGIKLLTGLLTFTATASVAPLSGNLKITFQGMSD